MISNSSAYNWRSNIPMKMKTTMTSGESSKQKSGLQWSLLPQLNRTATDWPGGDGLMGTFHVPMRYYFRELLCAWKVSLNTSTWGAGIWPIPRFIFCYLFEKNQWPLFGESHIFTGLPSNSLVSPKELFELTRRPSRSFDSARALLTELQGD